MSLNAEHFEKLRQHMVAEITAETIFVSGRIGKAALGQRAMQAIGKVPRHEFVCCIFPLSVRIVPRKP